MEVVSRVEAALRPLEWPQVATRARRFPQVGSALIAEWRSDRWGAALVTELGGGRRRAHEHWSDRRRCGSCSCRRSLGCLGLGRRAGCQPGVSSALVAKDSADRCSAFVAEVCHVEFSSYAASAPALPLGGRGRPPDSRRGRRRCYCTSCDNVVWLVAKLAEPAKVAVMLWAPVVSNDVLICACPLTRVWRSARSCRP